MLPSTKEALINSVRPEALSLPVMADIVDEDIRQLEKTLKSFEIEGVSINTKPSEMESLFTDRGFKLKEKAKNRNGRFYLFKKDVKKNLVVVRINTLVDNEVIQRINAIFPPESNKSGFDELKKQLDTKLSMESKVRECNSVRNDDGMISQSLSAGSDIAFAKGVEVGRELL